MEVNNKLQKGLATASPLSAVKSKSEWGTYEWSEYILNCITGCEHSCLYCYSKEMMVRYKKVTPKTWELEQVRQHDLTKKIKKYPGRVMFPSSHDITPTHLEENVFFLRKILEAGNDVLIVSKPHLVCIIRICEEFSFYKDKILFRFTIGSRDSNVLKFWEPNAPSFEERLKSLKYAYKHGFQTSVSCEPMLDNRIDKVIKAVASYVTETIWIGKINKLIGKTGRGRLDFNEANDPYTLQRAQQLIVWQSDEEIVKLYNKYCNNPKIMWKESIKRVIEKNARKVADGK